MSSINLPKFPLKNVHKKSNENSNFQITSLDCKSKIISIVNNLFGAPCNYLSIGDQGKFAQTCTGALTSVQDARSCVKTFAAKDLQNIVSRLSLFCSKMGTPSKLEVLDLHNCDVTDDDLAFIVKNFPNLKILNITYRYRKSQITDKGLAHIAKLTFLESLDLTSWEGQITDKGLACLTNLFFLKSLNFTGCIQITDKGLACFAKLDLLESLDFTNCEKITGTGFEYIANHRFLKSLDLSGCINITDDVLEHLAKLPLKYLVFRRCELITNKGLSFLVRLRLISFKFEECNKITAEGLGCFLAQITSLEDLDFNQCNQVTDEFLDFLKRLLFLRSLSISVCRSFTGTGFKYLHKQRLISLILYACSITDEGLKYVSTFPLTSLDLGCNRTKLTDEGFQYINKVTSLTSLSFAGHRDMTDKDIALLNELSQLSYLNLYVCQQLTDSVFKCLDKFPLLTDLNVSGCKQITDTGFASISELSHLRCIRLAGCNQLTDGVFKYLDKCSLEYLDIAGCNQLTNVGLEHLISRNPLLKVLCIRKEQNNPNTKIDELVERVESRNYHTSFDRLILNQVDMKVYDSKKVPIF